MPIDTINIQPGLNSYFAAYRPVLFEVVARATDGTPKPPVVYCDIYFNDVYYKTISRTQYTSANLVNSVWTFDVEDAAQEYLQYFLGVNGSPLIQAALPVSVKVLVRFRSSGINSSGFIESEGTAPIQATGETPAVSGTGTASNLFFITNSTLQFEDNQDLLTHLGYYKYGVWYANYFPLTHRPNPYKICKNGSDFYPIISLNATALDVKIILTFKNFNEATEYQSIADISIPTANVLYVPNGLKNLSSIFPTVNIDIIESYRVQLITDLDVMLITTPLNVVAECCNIRLHFENYLGTIDTIDCREVQKTHETNSTTYQQPLALVLDKIAHSVNRYNINAIDKYQLAFTVEDETQMNWITEIFDSPRTWLELKGTQGQADGYLPVIVTNQSFAPKKEEDRYLYEIFLEIQLSHNKITIRN